MRNLKINSPKKENKIKNKRENKMLKMRKSKNNKNNKINKTMMKNKERKSANFLYTNPTENKYTNFLHKYSLTIVCNTKQQNLF
jgi:hypothetical protein